MSLGWIRLAGFLVWFGECPCAQRSAVSCCILEVLESLPLQPIDTPAVRRPTAGVGESSQFFFGRQ